jgi:hypothetical protein
VMETAFPLASLPSATNCCVPPMSRVTGPGVTLTLASGPGVIATVAYPERRR